MLKSKRPSLLASDSIEEDGITRNVIEQGGNGPIDQSARLRDFGEVRLHIEPRLHIFL